MWKLFLLAQIALADVTEYEVVNEVLSKFPAVQMSQQDLKAAEAQELTARGAFDIVFEGDWKDTTGDYNYSVFESQIKKPTPIFGLDLYGGFRESQGGIPIYYGEQETLDRGEWNVGAKLPLLRGFLTDSRRAGLNKSKLQVTRQNLQLRATELREIEKALFAYWNWKVALGRWRIQKNLLDIAKLRDEWLAKRTRAGDIPAFERKDNLRTVLLRQSALLQADLELKSREAQLAVFFSNESLQKKVESSTLSDRNIESQWFLPQQMSEFKQPIDALMGRALIERPEFAAIATQLQQLEIDKDLQQNQFLPKLDLKAEYSKDRGVGSSTLDDDNTTVSLQLQVPLQYRNIRGQRDQISANIRKVELERQLLERQWKADLIAIQKNLEVATARRDLSLQEYELAKQLENGERTRFRQGDTNVLIVNLREQASAEASLRIIETTADLLRAYASLEVRLGKIPFVKGN
jgi:outer membrane protein, heavy metal efflux system